MNNYIFPIILVLMASCVFMVLNLYQYMFFSSTLTQKELDGNTEVFTTVIGYFLLISFGMMTLIFGIQYFTYLTSLVYSFSGLTKLILNLFLIVAIFGIFFKAISYTQFYKNSKTVQMVVNTFFAVPVMAISATNAIQKSVSTTSSSEYLLLAIAVLLNAGYYLYPYAMDKYVHRDGLQLVNMPVFTDTPYSLGSYIDLNGKDTFDYAYGLSFWVYINSTNTPRPNYISLLNYGNKPNVLYNTEKHTLMITMSNPYSRAECKLKKIRLDEEGNVIIFKKTDILFQKWNHIAVNYNGGTMDVFYNGELVKSFPQIVPHMNYDNLTIGAENGVGGGICNVNYFRNPLTMKQIDDLYTLVKENTPPVYSKNDQTITSVLLKS